MPFNSHGQPAYFDGKNYITPDVDSHNLTNGWEMFDRRGNRIGTYIRTTSMHNSNELNVCRVCGAKQVEPPWGNDGLTPNYEICDCCGVEFGYEDMNLNALKKYREKWIEKGAIWFREKEKPTGWSLDEQLKNIPTQYR